MIVNLTKNYHYCRILAIITMRILKCGRCRAELTRNFYSSELNPTFIWQYIEADVLPILNLWLLIVLKSYEIQLYIKTFFTLAHYLNGHITQRSSCKMLSKDNVNGTQRSKGFVEYDDSSMDDASRIMKSLKRPGDEENQSY